MHAGYASFPDDVKDIWQDIIQSYHFTATREEEDVVVLQNDHTEIVLTALEDSMNASLKADGKYINVVEWAYMVDQRAYLVWKEQKDHAVQGLSREAFYQAYLRQLKILAEQYFTGLMQSGAIPRSEAYDHMTQNRKIAESKFERAWKGLQGLDIQHPVRQKYLRDDPGWVDDMIRLLDGD